MKDNLFKIFKILLIAAVCILISLFVFGLVLSLDWPWWVGFFILLAIIGLYVGFLFLKKLRVRRKEQQFIQGVIEQDDDYLKSVVSNEKDELKGLQTKWKESVEALKRSHLRKEGNPLYVLPWYLIIGESGSGKTTAISSADLASPFEEVCSTSGISGTRNCDWWFFDKAILIDTAGRYSIRIDEERDKEEWRSFLTLLTKYRKREPINGVIVTIAADKLLKETPEVLEKDGRDIRRRIDELIMGFGFKFPIYVLVTKCDLVQGMSDFCDFIPEKNLGQAMGLANQELTKDVFAFCEQAINSVGKRLRNLRLLLLHQPEFKDNVDPGILIFPEEFKNLKQGLSSFLKGAFAENPYQEVSIFRGIFFSSGRQEGSPFSHFLNDLGLNREQEILPGTNKGLFLHDFFSKIIPGDRGLFVPTKRTDEWSKLTRNLGLASWFFNLCISLRHA